MGSVYYEKNAFCGPPAPLAVTVKQTHHETLSVHTKQGT